MIQGKRSSVQIATSGDCSSGRSIEQIVTSIHSESSASWKNNGVPQQLANDLSLLACLILVSFPDNSTRLSLGKEAHATMGAALARRQSTQKQMLVCLGGAVN